MAEPRTSSRPIQSCFQCRKRKIKCSKSYPCTPCILRGEGETCREVDRTLLHEHRRSCDKLEELVDRVQKLENTISVLSTRGSPSSEGSPRSLRRRELSSTPYSKSPSPTPKRPCSRGIRSPAPTPLRASTRAEEAAMILEDFAMGHKVNQARATSEFSASPYSTPSSSSESLPINGLPASHPWSLLVNSPREVAHRLSSMLPTQAQIQLLLQFYVDWYAKVIHAPTFMVETNTILSHINNHRYHLVNIDLLGVLLAVLCLSFHFADTSLCEQLFLDYSACSEYAQHLYAGAQACLQYANFTGCHTLEHLQTIILIGVYQQNNDESDGHWALTGAAIKIAQNLGMSRLGNETGTRRYPSEWRSSIRREVARRVWWCLVFGDWSHAMAHQGSYSIHPSQNHTSLPANIDDADLVESDVVQSKPLNVHTEMSSFLCRLRFIDLHRQVIDEINGGSYDLDFALDMDSRVNGVISEIKDYFQVATDSRKAFSRSNEMTSFERTICQMMAQERLLQLHRPFLFQSYHDSRYTQARNQCIRAAQLILQHLGTKHRAERLLRWSIVVFYVFAASVVLFIDLCYLHCNGTDADIRQRRAEVQNVLQLLRTVGPSAPAVTRNAVRLLEQMLVTEAAMSPDQECALDDSTYFEQVARTIIMNATQGTRSNLTMGHLPTPLDLDASLSVSTTPTPEPLWHPQFLDINLSSGMLLEQDPGVFSGVGIPFDEVTAAGLPGFTQANGSSTFFA